ncbi:MAG: FtsX-like permease family protein [Pseudolysinimonas sp.]
MARPAFSGRRALSRIGQLLAFAGVVMLVAGFLAFLGGAAAPVLDAGARRLVDGAGATGSTVRIQTRLTDDADDQDAGVQQAIEVALRGLPATVHRSVLAESAPAEVDDEPVRVQALADPDLPGAAQLTAGEWPDAVDEGALQAAAAGSMGVGIGDEVVVGDLPVTIVGTWVANDPAADRWFGDPAVGSGSDGDAKGPLLVDESVLAPLDEHPFVRWTIVPEPSAIQLSTLGTWADALARLDAEVRRLPTTNSSLDVLGTLPATLARTSRSTSVAAGILGLPLVLLVVAGGVVLGLIARAIASGRRVEFALLRARGASLRALTGAAAREAAVAALVGGLVGTAAAVAVLMLGIPVPIPGAASVTVVVLSAAVAAAVVLLAIALATIVTVVELRAPVTGRAESGRAALLASLGPLVLAAVAAGLALAQFVALGGPIVVRADDTVRTDPLALAAPMAVLVAAALAAPVVIGPLSLIAERIARGSRGILPVLPLRQLARRARSVAAGVLVIALATGAVVLVGAFQLSAQDAAARAERAATGADLRLQYAVRATVGEGFPAASAADVAGITGIDDSFAVLAQVSSLGQDAIPLVAADPGRLATLTGIDPAFAALTGDLTSARAVVPLPEGADELTVTGSLSPAGDVPETTEIDIVAWLTDADGSALFARLGSVPASIAGPVSVSGPLPEGATGILALAFSPAPTLPPGASIGVHLDGLSTPSGDVEWTGSREIGVSEPQRILPPVPDGGLPVVLSRELSDRLGAEVGVQLGMRVGGVPAQIVLRVAGVLDRLPGLAGPLGMVTDLQSLETAALAVSGSVPAANELWLTAPDPDAALTGLRESLTVRASIVTPSTVSTRPVLEPAIALFAAGAAATVVLAILGFAAVAAAIGRQRRIEFTPLRSLGLTPARVRRARAIELVASALLAIALGVGAGILTAVLVVPGLVAVAT